MTEDQAKKLVCHRTLAALALEAEEPVFAQAKCIASACMAWQFDPKDPKGKQGDCALKRIPA